MSRSRWCVFFGVCWVEDGGGGERGGGSTEEVHEYVDQLSLSFCLRFLTGQGCHSQSFVEGGQVENQGV